MKTGTPYIGLSLDVPMGTGRVISVVCHNCPFLVTLSTHTLTGTRKLMCTSFENQAIN